MILFEKILKKNGRAGKGVRWDVVSYRHTCIHIYYLQITEPLTKRVVEKLSLLIIKIILLLY